MTDVSVSLNESSTAVVSSDARMLVALDAAAKSAAEEAAAKEAGGEYEEGNGGGGEYMDDGTVPLASVDDFEKTLQSDVNENQALLLLMDVQACDPVFKVFNDDDMDRLARYLSVLSFEQGEQIISKGEPASFCGIVLSGRFDAIISEQLSISLEKGNLVGEMSYYEGGKRTADIICMEPAVLAVISFSDLKKLQIIEAEVVAKFLHMLAVISIRKLRNMLKTPAPSATPATTAEKKEGDAATTTSTAASSTTAAAAAAASPASPAATPSTDPKSAPLDPNSNSDKAQESLFVARLNRKKERAARGSIISISKEALADAQREADLAKKKSQQAQKSIKDASYKHMNLENKIKVLEKQLDELKVSLTQSRDAHLKSKEQIKLLTIQISSMSSDKNGSEIAGNQLNAKIEQLQLDRDSLAAGTSIMISNLEKNLEISQKAHSSTRAILDVELSRTKLLSKNLDEVMMERDLLMAEKRGAGKDYETFRNNYNLALEKITQYEKTIKSINNKIIEEELLSISWKSKAELYLGDYTRQTTRLRDMDLIIIDLQKDRRLNLRMVTQMRYMLRKIIIRNFIRNVRSRKLIFAIFKRVNSVVSSRVELTLTDPAASALTVSSSETGASQALSLIQLRKDRVRLMNFLKNDRTPVSKLIWLLDEELSNFESPFHALQAENDQLRHTLDSFFKRNIGLMSSFMSAKTEYENLHREYSRVRAAWARIHKISKEKGFITSSINDDDDDIDAPDSSSSPSNNVANFRSSIPTPQPFSPTNIKGQSYSNTINGRGATYSPLPPAVISPPFRATQSYSNPSPSASPARAGQPFNQTNPSPLAPQNLRGPFGNNPTAMNYASPVSHGQAPRIVSPSSIQSNNQPNANLNGIMTIREESFTNISLSGPRPTTAPFVNSTVLSPRKPPVPPAASPPVVSPRAPATLTIPTRASRPSFSQPTISSMTHVSQPSPLAQAPHSNAASVPHYFTDPDAYDNSMRGGPNDLNARKPAPAPSSTVNTTSDGAGFGFQASAQGRPASKLAFSSPRDQFSTQLQIQSHPSQFMRSHALPPNNGSSFFFDEQSSAHEEKQHAIYTAPPAGRLVAYGMPIGGPQQHQQQQQHQPSQSFANPSYTAYPHVQHSPQSKQAAPMQAAFQPPYNMQPPPSRGAQK